MKKVITVHNYKAAKEAVTRRVAKESAHFVSNIPSGTPLAKLVQKAKDIRSDAIEVAMYKNALLIAVGEDFDDGDYESYLEVFGINNNTIEEIFQFHHSGDPHDIISDDFTIGDKENYFRYRKPFPTKAYTINDYAKLLTESDLDCLFEALAQCEKSVSDSANESHTRRIAKESANKTPAVFIDASGSMYFSLSKTIATAKKKFGDKAKYFAFNDDVSEVDINSLSNDNLGGGTNFSKLEKFINSNKSRFSTITIYTDSGVELEHYNLANATIIDVDSLPDSASASQTRKVAKESWHSEWYDDNYDAYAQDDWQDWYGNETEKTGEVRRKHVASRIYLMNTIEKQYPSAKINMGLWDMEIFLDPTEISPTATTAKELLSALLKAISTKTASKFTLNGSSLVDNITKTSFDFSGAKLLENGKLYIFMKG